MAVLAYTAAIQTRIAYALRMQAYSALTDGEKEMIDGTWTTGALDGGVALDALTQIQQLGQYFSLTAPTSVISEWESWLVQRTVMYAAQAMAPDRMQHYIEMHDSAMMAAIDAYQRNLVTYDPGATPEATVLTIQNIRYYVTGLLVRRDSGWETVEGTRRRRPRKWIPFEIIDACIEKVIRNTWNRANWIFKKRSGTITLTRYAVTAATYTHATKKITKTAGFATTIPTGASVRVTAGTSATLGDYITSSTAADADNIYLTASLGSAADGQTDIACKVIAVGNNLVGETFHQFASRELYFNDDPTSKVRWASNDEMAQAKAAADDGESEGRPYLFNWEDDAGVLTWHFFPEPDQSYTLRAQSYVKGPELTTLTATTTALARFPGEFHNVIKDAIFAEVLDKIADRDARHQIEKSEDEIMRLLPMFAEPGKPDDNPQIRDVYDDYARLGSPSYDAGDSL